MLLLPLLLLLTWQTLGRHPKTFLLLQPLLQPSSPSVTCSFNRRRTSSCLRTCTTLLTRRQLQPLSLPLI